MQKIDVAGLKIDAVTKNELLSELLKRIKAGQKIWAATPYSEFLYHALEDREVMETFNKADVAVPDGIGIFWAKRFLDIPLTAKSYFGKILQAFWQAFYSLCAILVKPKWIYKLNTKSAFAKATADSRYVKNMSWEKISGADLIWDLAKLAADNNLSIYLLGGFGDTPKLAAEKLQTRINNGRNLSLSLKIAGWSNKNPDDPTIIDNIKNASPDLLFVAYGPIKQERWIASNLPNLPVKLAIGLGGTFDYIAGKKPNPPRFLRQTGLEWLYRLFTQPHRKGRIRNAFFGLILAIIRYKFFNSLPYRNNVVSVILNHKNEIFVGLRNPEDLDLRDVGDTQVVLSGAYWQLPQGGVDSQEDLVQAAKREVREETGIKNLKPIKISKKIHDYSWHQALRPMIKNKYHFKGQSQQIVFLRFEGKNEEIIMDNVEFIKFKWVPGEQLDKTVHPERVPLAKIVQEDLKEMREKGIIDK